MSQGQNKCYIEHYYVQGLESCHICNNESYRTVLLDISTSQAPKNETRTVVKEILYKIEKTLNQFKK